MVTPTEDQATRVFDFVRIYADRSPEVEALVLDDYRMTYAELAAHVDACAKALLNAGIQRGDRVAMLGAPRPEYFIMFLATGKVGGIWLGLNPKYHFDELDYVVGDSTPMLIIGQTVLEGRDFADDLRTLKDAHPEVKRLVLLGDEGRGVTESFEEFLNEGEGVTEEALERAVSAVDPMDATLLVYTSGSTGRPKGAMLSHHGLVRCSYNQNEHLPLDPARIICNLPINHIGCTGDICCSVLAAGGTIIFMESFDPQGVLRTIQEEQVTIWGQVPTMFQIALAQPNFEDYDLSSLQWIVWSGAALPYNLVEKLGTLGARLLTCYGMTETTGSVTFTAEDADSEVLAETIGRAESRYELRLTKEDGTECGPGEQGEIQVRGDFIMIGYFNRPEATRETVDTEGWLHTGDIGLLRDDGNISFVGRLSEMYKSGGYNVYPREIEIALEEHSAVAMAAVIGVPDPLFQEVGHAFVIPHEGACPAAEELRSYCKERLANYKVPKQLFIRATLPMLPIGKVDKIALRKEIQADRDQA